MRRPVLFYDGQCPLCRREIAHYQRLDHHQRVDWQDLFAPDCTVRTYGIDTTNAMRVIHAVDSDGSVCKGVYAFLIVWQSLPYYRHLAWLIRALHLARPLDVFYHTFARWRFRKRCNQGCKLPPR
ncbi:thiol-disulfide oxidoreductase DCC family protein [Marinobacterium sediminicola]|uniref:thiol-disulfide oxidoreductase DCC family protein n=1 Tax=Marinobacterium sediminicola TaxID=518898 RepID=UPI001EEFD219|nr:DUF393 domain-containing protein [Marinobacterium sediminicola]ULG67796.1 DUF393 domain-containing protein [Marinobacterium sediminicola]